MVLALLALGASVAGMIAVSMWDRRPSMRPATAPPRAGHGLRRQSDA
jgi:hypothetical protein